MAGVEQTQESEDRKGHDILPSRRGKVSQHSHDPTDAVLACNGPAQDRAHQQSFMEEFKEFYPLPMDYWQLVTSGERDVTVFSCVPTEKPLGSSYSSRATATHDPG